MMNLALPMDLMTTGHHHHQLHQQQQQQQQQQQHHQLAVAAAAAAAVASGHHHHHHHQQQQQHHLNTTNHHHPTRLYNSPPPISNSDPTVNDCKLIEYRGKKLVSFTVTGEQMLCLPQAVDLFLKNYVGGPHTVYCKLKRLDIVPLVCNTEQIRILRGLGVLQPGVNRCKLLSCKDFDVLLDDCENASSRPGRPPKRGPLGMPLPTDYLPSSSSSSASASATQHSQLKKHRLDNADFTYENGHLIDSSRLDKSALLAAAAAAAAAAVDNNQQINQMASFMHLNSFPGIMSRMSTTNTQSSSATNNEQQQQQQQLLQLPTRLSDDQILAIKDSTRNDMEAIIRSGLWTNANYQTQYEDMVKHLERLKEERDDSNRSSNSDHQHQLQLQHHHQHQPKLLLAADQQQQSNSSATIQIGDNDDNQLSPILNLSKSNRPSDSNDFDCSGDDAGSDEKSVPANLSVAGSLIEIDEFSNKLKSDQDLDIELNNNNNTSRPASSISPPLISPRNLSPSPSPAILEERTFSMEVLLRNIQALLKIATDNAMQHEKQTIYEKAELKMDVLREKEGKDSIEKQLMEERKLRVLYQKRYRKERKLRTRLG